MLSEYCDIFRPRLHSWALPNRIAGAEPAAITPRKRKTNVSASKAPSTSTPAKTIRTKPEQSLHSTTTASASEPSSGHSDIDYDPNESFVDYGEEDEELNAEFEEGLQSDKSTFA